MKRLRHPIRAIREPFGTAGLIIACIALIAALGGTAFAATRLNSKQKKEVEKIAKKYAGKPGASGTNGTNGSPGAAGKDGTNGTNGADGKSVTEASATSGECNGVAGGVKYTLNGNTTKVCSGKNGTTGFTETLPSEETETGTWATVTSSKACVSGFAGCAEISTSFNIPLSAPLTMTGCYTQPQPTSCQVHLIAPNGKELIANSEAEKEEVNQRTPAPCPGTAQTPEAEPGNLCAYVAEGDAAITLLQANAFLSTPGGVVLPSLISVEEGKRIYGSWAVTAQ